MKGIPWHVFLTAFSSCPSALSGDSSPAKNNENQALMSHCKNSLKDKAVRGSREKPDLGHGVASLSHTLCTVAATCV